MNGRNTYSYSAIIYSNDFIIRPQFFYGREREREREREIERERTKKDTHLIFRMCMQESIVAPFPTIS